MSTNDDTEIIAVLRGSAAYRRYLTRLGRSVRDSGARLDALEGAYPWDALAEHALAVLGLAHGLRAPAMRPRRRGGRLPSPE